MAKQKKKPENINDIAAAYSSMSAAERREAEERACGLMKPIVNTILSRYGINNPDKRNDLYMEGMLAGIEALRKFDPGYGSKFTTFAFSFISKSVGAGIQNLSVSGEAKHYLNRELVAYKKAKKELSNSLRREPSIDELSAKLGKKRSTILQYERAVNKPMSFEDLNSKPVGDDDEMKFEDELVDTGEEEWQEEIKDQEFKEDFDKFLASIDETDAEIIRMYVGYECRKMSFEEIANKLSLSKTMVFRKFKSYEDDLKNLLL